MPRKDVELTIGAKNDTKKGVDSAERDVKAFARGVKVAVGAATVAVTGLTLAFGRAVNDLDKLAKSARFADIGAESFQSWRIQADLAGVSNQSFDASLERANKRIGEARNGLGAAKKTYEQYGIALTDVNGKARSNEAILRDAADAFAGMDTAAERGAAAAALFGREGIALAEVLKGGTGQLDEFGRKARAAGLILSTDTTEKAEKFKDQMTLLKGVFDAGLNTALAQMIPALIGIGQTMAATVPHMSTYLAFLDDFVQGGPVSGDSAVVTRLRDERAELDKTVLAYEKARRGSDVGSGNFQGQARNTFSFFPGPTEEEFRKAKARIKEIRETLLPKALRDLSETNVETGFGEALDAAQERAAALITLLKEVETGTLGADTAIKTLGETVARGDFVFDPFVDDGAEDIKGALQNLFDDIDLNIDEAVKKEAEQIKEQQELSDNIADAIRLGATDGADGMVDALLNALLDNFITQAADMIAGALSGDGGGFLGGLGSFLGFGGARMNGGPVGTGSAYLVGEAGPELFVPSSAGRIVPNGAFGGGVTVQNNFGNVSFSGGAESQRQFNELLERSSDATVARVQQMARQGTL